MNILFLSLYQFDTISDRNIYPDLLREFIKNGHQVYAISPIDSRNQKDTYFVKEDQSVILRLKIGKTEKTNIIKKGISTVLLESTIIKGIKKYFSDVKFDLVLYATPPVTFCNVVRFVKKRDGAKTYLLLKDIFPQNSVDLGMLSKNGVKGIIYQYFRNKEKRLYSLSDHVGCMSQANVDYLLANNKQLSSDAVEVCPNSVEPRDLRISWDEKVRIRRKFNIPEDKLVLVYGGNLGKPQGIEFMIECIRKSSDKKVYYIIAGSGTEYGKLKEYIDTEKPDHIKLCPFLPKDEYDEILSCGDVGLVFLDYRFTIPNFPSRILPYMQAGLPVISCTDENTDMGKIIEEGDFGWSCYSNNSDAFCSLLDTVVMEDLSEKSCNAFAYLFEHYMVSKVYDTIIEKCRQRSEVV